MGVRLIQVDNAAWTLGKNLTPTLSLLADPKLALQELSEVVVPSMSAAAQQQATQRRAAMAVQKQHERERQERRIQEHWDSTPIAPARLMAALRVCLPATTVFYNEAITATGISCVRSLWSNPGACLGITAAVLVRVYQAPWG